MSDQQKVGFWYWVIILIGEEGVRKIHSFRQFSVNLEIITVLSWENFNFQEFFRTQQKLDLLSDRKTPGQLRNEWTAVFTKAHLWHCQNSNKVMVIILSNESSFLGFQLPFRAHIKSLLGQNQYGCVFLSHIHISPPFALPTFFLLPKKKNFA